MRGCFRQRGCLLAGSGVLLLSGCGHGQAPAKGASVAVAAVSSVNTDPHVLHMKRVGFSTQAGMPAMPAQHIEAIPTRDLATMAMLVPADWTFQGVADAPAVMDCDLTYGRIRFAALNADKSAGLLVQTAYPTQWSTDATYLHYLAQQNIQYGKGMLCVTAQPQTLAEAMPRLAEILEKGTIVTGPLEPVPGFSDKVAGMFAPTNQRLADQAGPTGHPSVFTAEAGRMRIGKRADRPAADAYLYAAQVTRTDILPSGAKITTTDVPLLAGIFAPEGKLAGSQDLFDAMLDSVVVTRAWLDFVSHLRASMVQLTTPLETQAPLNGLRRKELEDGMPSVIAKDPPKGPASEYSAHIGDGAPYAQHPGGVGWQKPQPQSPQVQQFALHLDGLALYAAPDAPGKLVQVSSRYPGVWAGPGGEFMLADSSMFTPSGAPSGAAVWTRLKSQVQNQDQNHDDEQRRIRLLNDLR